MSTKGYPWYRKSHRCWYVWHQGRQVRLSPDEKETLRLWHRLEAGVWVPEEGGVTLSEVVDAYLEDCKGRQRQSSVGMKRSKLVPLCESMPARFAASALTREIVEKFLEGKKTWGATLRWQLSCYLKACLHWAVRTKMIPSFPLEGWSIPRPKSKRPDAVVSTDTHLALMAVAPEWLKDVLTALHQTGCRPSEALSVAAADHKGDCWVLSEHKTSGKGGAPRVIHLSAVAVALTERLAALHPAGPLFRDGLGERIRNAPLGHRLRRLCCLHGLPHVYPYAYRHTFATDLLAAGVPDATVAELMGHSGTKILHEHYSHLCARQRHLRESLARARRGGSG